MKRLHTHSQHFLRSPRLVKELLGHSSIKQGDTVYDIGAGSGVITSVLAERVHSVVAIEPEPHAASKLRKNMEKYSHVRVLEEDFLGTNLPNGSYKVFANIPFHLSSAITRKLIEAKHPPDAIYLIVQKQFANKLLIDKDGFTGQLGAYIAPWFEARIRKRLQKTDFWPHPNVDTVLLELKPRKTPILSKSDMPSYQAFTFDCFSTPKLFAQTPRNKVNIPLHLKPSQLRLDQWVALFGASNSHVIQ